MLFQSQQKNITKNSTRCWQKVQGKEISSLVALLEALGFQLGITVEDSELSADSESTEIGEAELSPEPANL